MVMIITKYGRTTLPICHVILSKSATYAVRALLCLAEAGSDEPTTVDQIAATLEVPRNYLSKILHVLARTEILDSTRGPGGGFRLARSPAALPLSDIVRHFDVVPDSTTCLLGRVRCSDTTPCRAHERWSITREAIITFLDGTTLADLAHDGSSADACGALTREKKTAIG
jgi:Rrf2 family iron-sulfur cluster assembly transcriptional regulator